MPDDNNADSSTASDQSIDALAGGDFAAYAAAQNAIDQGKPLPEASAPSKESSEPTPASESGTATEIQEKPKHKNGEDRKAQLKAEIDELLRQRAELRGETEKPGEKIAAPPPASVEPPKANSEAKPEALKKPRVDDFATYGEYEAAYDRYIADFATAKAHEAIEVHETKREAAERNKGLAKAWDDQVSTGKEEHADFAEVAFSQSTPISTVMNDFILKSGVGPKILYELGLNGSAEGKRIFALPPFEAMEALVSIKLSLKPAPAAKSDSIPVKKHTSAPPPATSLSGKTAENVDSPEAALAAGDFAGYMQKANARDRAARR